MLGVMALIAALIGAVSLLVRSAVDSASAGRDELAFAGLARAGIELAGYQLYALRTPFEAVGGQQVRFDAGVATLFVTDESGRIDLNGADPALLAGLGRAAGGDLAPASFAARAADWRDEDNELSRSGAELSEYASAGLSQRPRNDAFRSVDDLRWLLGVSPIQAAAMARLATVHNPDGKVNVLSAPREVLLALPDIAPPTVDGILSMRRGSPKESIGPAIMAQLGKQQAMVKAEPGPSYRVRVEARIDRTRARTVEAVLTASRSPDALYYVVDWTE